MAIYIRNKDGIEKPSKKIAAIFSCDVYGKNSLVGLEQLSIIVTV
jgi:hypothetical protein